MLIIIPSRNCECECDCEKEDEGQEIKPVDNLRTAVKAADEKPKDWAYMEQSGEVLANHPDTWQTYPNTIQGRMQIIDMEYCELQDAKAKGRDVSKELVHLGSATLYLWRLLNNAE